MRLFADPLLQTLDVLVRRLSGHTVLPVQSSLVAITWQQPVAYHLPQTVSIRREHVADILKTRLALGLKNGQTRNYKSVP